MNKATTSRKRALSQEDVHLLPPKRTSPAKPASTTFLREFEGSRYNTSATPGFGNISSTGETITDHIDPVVILDDDDDSLLTFSSARRNTVQTLTGSSVRRNSMSPMIASPCGPSNLCSPDHHARELQPSPPTLASSAEYRPSITIADSDNLNATFNSSIDDPYCISSEDEGDSELEILEERRLSTLQRGRRTSIRSQRNAPKLPPWRRVEKASLRDMVLTRGTFVELIHDEFLLITELYHHGFDKKYVLRGHQFTRTRYLSGFVPRKLNELVWFIELDKDDDRPAMVQSLKEVELDDVLRIREVNATNEVGLKHSFRDYPYNTGDKKILEAEARLCVRWQYTSIWYTEDSRLRNSFALPERTFRMLKEADIRFLRAIMQSDQADHAEVVCLPHRERIRQDEEIRKDYRGDTPRGGSYDPTNPPPSFGLVQRPRKNSLTRSKSAPRSLVQAQNARPITIDLDPIVLDYEEMRPACTRSGSLRLEAGTAIESPHILINDENDEPLTSGSGPSAGHRVPDEDQRRPSDSGRWSSDVSSTRNNSQASSLWQSAQHREYTYGDGFCGAGGATRGAQQAGLRVLYGFDHCPTACNSWNLNFPDSTCWEMSADELHAFATAGSTKSQRRGWAHLPDGNCLRCDILHLSPPCQPFSPAHTVIGQNDDANTASLTAVESLIKLVKPRIVTLEQTFGILREQCRVWFYGLINMFTSQGYSVRWRVALLQHFGLPQCRQRLIIFASAPGEVLPKLPEYTHAPSPTQGPGQRMKPLTSVRSVLRSIPENHPDHNVDAVGKLNLAPWDDSGICKRAITTHGGQNYHPSGKRHLTNREFACLQGFPLEHRFSTTHVKKQIGNAVPPFVAKILFKAVVKALREADGLEPEEPDIIDLDGDAPDELDVIHLEEMTLEQPAKMNVVNDKSESPEVIDLEDADKEQPEVIHLVNDRPESPELIELETEMREVVIIG